MAHDDSGLFIGIEIRNIKRNLYIYCEIVELMLDYKYTLVVHMRNWDKLKKHRRILWWNENTKKMKVEVDVEGNTGYKMINPIITISWNNHPNHGNRIVSEYCWSDAGMCCLDTEFLESLREGLRREGKELHKEAVKLFWEKK